MSNSVIIIGRLAKNIDDNNEILLSVSRLFKNEEGIYETDLIPITIWQGISSQMKECCTEGSLVGVRGRIETKDNKIIIIGEKVTFLSNKEDNK